MLLQRFGGEVGRFRKQWALVLTQMTPSVCCSMQPRLSLAPRLWHGRAVSNSLSPPCQGLLGCGTLPVPFRIAALIEQSDCHDAILTGLLHGCSRLRGQRSWTNQHTLQGAVVRKQSDRLFLKFSVLRVLPSSRPGCHRESDPAV